jgi:hypothetical protein
LRFYNDREGGRNIRMLQVNSASMAIWNRDGRYVILDNAGTDVHNSDDGKGLTAGRATYFPVAGQPPQACPNPLPPGISCSNNAFTSDGGVPSFLYRILDADVSAPATSFQRWGYAAADRSHGGMVVHMGMGSATPTYTEGESPYAFALIGSRQLFGRARYNGYTQNPAGVTFASPQAVYVQGDFNNFLTTANHGTFVVDSTSPTFSANFPETLVWQPASVLADSINVLSNRCRNTLFDRVVKTGSGQNCNSQTDSDPLDNNSGSRPGASPTTTRVAFLSGTDVTGSSTVPGFSGGIQNYPRYSEGWGNNNYHVYAGSFVSLGIPNEVSGRWDDQAYGPPRRIWAFETRFNDAANLPPLTPRFVSMQQEIFRRRFSR